MRPNRVLLVLLVGSVLVHTITIAWVQTRLGRIDALAFNSLDSGEYYSLARNILYHGTFSQDEAVPFTPDTWRTPGYPLYLAGVILLVGDSPTALILVHHLTCIASVLLFFWIAARHMSPGRAAMAAALVLLEPYHVYYANWLLSTSMLTLLLLFTWWAWECAWETASRWHFIFPGLMGGFLVLAWPGAILIPLFLVAGYFFLIRKKVFTVPNHHIAQASGATIGLLMVVVGILIPPVVWMARNKSLAGHFALSHQSGIVLAYFKATEVELWRQGRTEDRYVETSLNPASRGAPRTVWDRIDAKLCERLVGDPGNCGELRWYNLAQGNKTTLDSFTISSTLSAIGREMLLASPISSISCGLVRVVENLAFPLGLAIKPAREVPTNRGRSFLLGTVYAGLALGAGAGVWRMRKNPSVIYFPLVCIIALALTTSPQIDPRFRVPLIPFLVFLAFVPAHSEGP